MFRLGECLDWRSVEIGGVFRLGSIEIGGVLRLGECLDWGSIEIGGVLRLGEY